MDKLVLFDIIDGDFERGFTVTLRIETEENRRWLADAKGRLPPAIDLPQHYQQWQKTYRKRVSGRSANRMTVSGGTDSEILDEIKQAKKQLQVSLNNWLKPQGDFVSIWREIWTELQPNDYIRVVFKTDQLELQRLPWFLWDDFFAKYYRAEVGIYLSVKRQKNTASRNKVKVLAVFGKSDTTGNATQIQIDRDWEMLKYFLSEESNAELIRLNEPSLEKLCEAIDTERPQIFFFAGHSRSEEDETAGLIELNHHETITIEDLKYELIKAAKRGLELAIFNSCDGVGIAQQISQLGIPNIIVMREPVPDEVAHKFLQRFLEAFAAGKSLNIAVRRAREKIHFLERQLPGATWLPMIWQNPAETSLNWQSLGGVETGRRANFKTDENSSNTQPPIAPPPHQTVQYPLNSSQESWVGSILRGRYKIIALMGQGGFGRTYLAEDLDKLNQLCVVKEMIRVSTAGTEKVNELFEREAKQLAKLGKNPQITELLAYFKDDGKLYLVQEYIEGDDLEKELQERGKFDETEVIELLRELLPVIQFIHDHQVVHRDIKPSNIIRRRSDKRLILIDFGAVKEVTKTTIENTGTIIMTPGYASPEQSRGFASFSSDLYSLGVTAITLLTGKQPIELLSDSDFNQISCKQQLQGISPDLVAVLDKVTQNKPSDRYPTAKEMLKAVEKIKINSLFETVISPEKSKSLPTKIQSLFSQLFQK